MVLLARLAASTLLWAQHEPVAIYTSAGLSLHNGSSPTFATSAWWFNNSQRLSRRST